MLLEFDVELRRGHLPYNPAPVRAAEEIHTPERVSNVNSQPPDYEAQPKVEKVDDFPWRCP